VYIAVKGGAAAIEAAEQLLGARRRGGLERPAIDTAQIAGQLRLLVDRVMAEASLHDPELAALAVQQAQGDVTEAVFLLRAYRTTLPRLFAGEPLALERMRVQRRVSAVFKDLPGGQLLGPTFDYTQRLLDFGLLHAPEDAPPAPAGEAEAPSGPLPSALRSLVDEGLVEGGPRTPGDPEPPDITREPPAYPLPRAARLQMLARADEGWLLGLGYSTQRGYAYSHPFAGEIRLGRVAVEVVPDELGFAIEIGDIEVTDCQMITQFTGGHERPPQFTRGHGLVFGHGERKAMAMALVDRALRADEFGDEVKGPAQDGEFVLSHGDGVEASGFVQHLKLPHYVTFESELQLIRALREAAADPAPGRAPGRSQAGPDLLGGATADPGGRVAP
jgi:alpha-D-ribose 1-methylphosphonate 5-triphosphate synthase subunit PhnI